MSRTTAESVQAIIDVEDGKDLTPFIEIANQLVTDRCSSVSEYDDDKLELIERWLSAHFYTIYDPRSVREKAGSVSVEYQSKVDLGFDTSHYGQMAMRIDTAGGLAALNETTKKGKRSGVSISWLGKTKTELLNEDD